MADGLAPSGNRILPAESARAMRRIRVPTPALEPGQTGLGLAIRCHDWDGGHRVSTRVGGLRVRIMPSGGLAALLERDEITYDLYPARADAYDRTVPSGHLFCCLRG